MTTLKQEIQFCLINGMNKRDTLLEVSKFPHLSNVTLAEFHRLWDLTVEELALAESCTDWSSKKDFMRTYGTKSQGIDNLLI